MNHIYIHPYGSDKMFHGTIDSNKERATEYCRKHGFEPSICRIMVISQKIELAELKD